MAEEILAPAKDINERVDRLERTVSKQPFILPLYLNGKPDAGAVITVIPIPIEISFPVGMSGSLARAGVNPTAAAEYKFKKGDTVFATLTIGTTGSATWVCTVETVFQPGDLFSYVAPEAQDATLESVAITLIGWR